MCATAPDPACPLQLPGQALPAQRSRVAVRGTQQGPRHLPDPGRGSTGTRSCLGGSSFSAFRQLSSTTTLRPTSLLTSIAMYSRGTVRSLKAEAMKGGWHVL